MISEPNDIVCVNFYVSLCVSTCISFTKVKFYFTAKPSTSGTFGWNYSSSMDRGFCHLYNSKNSKRCRTRTYCCKEGNHRLHYLSGAACYHCRMLQAYTGTFPIFRSELDYYSETTGWTWKKLKGSSVRFFSQLLPLNFSSQCFVVLFPSNQWMEFNKTFWDCWYKASTSYNAYSFSLTKTMFHALWRAGFP